MPKRKLPKGFTLAELLIVSALACIVSLAIYTTFSQGAKIYKRLNAQIYEEELNFFGEKFARDLRNSFPFEKIKFNGTKQEVKFVSLLSGASSAGTRTGIGEVSYSFNPQKKILVRSQKDYSQFYRDAQAGQEIVLANLNQFGLEYYYYDDKEKKYFWEEEWAKSGLPIAVRITLEQEGGAFSGVFSQTFSIPVSSRLK